MIKILKILMTILKIWWKSWKFWWSSSPDWSSHPCRLAPLTSGPKRVAEHLSQTTWWYYLWWYYLWWYRLCWYYLKICRIQKRSNINYQISNPEESKYQKVHQAQPQVPTTMLRAPWSTQPPQIGKRWLITKNDKAQQTCDGPHQIWQLPGWAHMSEPGMDFWEMDFGLDLSGLDWIGVNLAWTFEKETNWFGCGQCQAARVVQYINFQNWYIFEWMWMILNKYIKTPQ